MASSGIPYWPTTLAYAAAALRQQKFLIHVIDMFGEAPKKIHFWENYYVQGLTPEEVLDRLKNIKFDAIITYAGMVHNHEAHLDLLRHLRQTYPKTPIITLENTQQVTSYVLSEVSNEFFSAGTSIIYTGEPEKYLSVVLTSLHSSSKLKKIPGLILKNHYLATDFPVKDLDKVPFPAWDLFPVEGYWSLGYAHGPKTHRKYLPLYSSRGCPFGCAFCTIPKLNSRLWRGRSGKNVVDEMEYWFKLWGVREFHFEDVNPAMISSRMEAISNEIISRKLPVIWKIVSGTKVEAVKPEVIPLMARAGCRYISISPESGSPRMLALMNKPFAHDLALQQIKHMHDSGITTQACFVLGFPGETIDDRRQTVGYVHKLARNGLDEIAPFIMTPMPGSSQWGKITGFHHLSQLTFSPSWRPDFWRLHLFRLTLFARFTFWRLVYNPASLLKSFMGLVTGSFYTKTEMTIHRLLRVRLWAFLHAR